MRSARRPFAENIFAFALLFTPRASRTSYGSAAREHFVLQFTAIRAASGTGAAALYLLTAAFDALGSGLIERFATLSRNVSYALRAARKTPAFSALIVATMAIAIGANVAIDSAISSIFLTQLPFADPQTLVTVWEPSVQGGDWALSYDDAHAVRSQSRTLDAAFLESSSGTVHGAGKVFLASGVAVSGNFFRVLQTRPQLGRLLTASDERSHAAVMVLSDRYWREAFGADAHIIGKTVTLGDKPRTIVGVLPPRVFTPDRWRGNVAQYGYYVPITAEGRDGGHQYRMVARRRPATSFEAVQADLGRIMDDRTRRYPQLDGGFQLRAYAVESEVLGDIAPVAAALAGLAFVVLVIACANVANLLLARGSSRLSELTVRYTLGASRRDILVQLLTESLVYALVAGLLGIALAALAFPALSAITPRWLAVIGPLTVDARTVALGALFVGITALVAGIAPALVLSRADLSLELKRAGRAGNLGAGNRLRSLLVAVEIAMTVGVVVVAGLALRTLDVRTHEPMGYVAQDRYVVNVVGVSFQRYPDAQAALRLVERVERELRSIPGVVSVANSMAIPDSNNPDTAVAVAGRVYPAGQTPEVKFNIISPSYFDVMQTPIIAGRAFRAADRLGTQPVALVDASYARSTFGGVNAALGKRIIIGHST